MTPLVALGALAFTCWYVFASILTWFVFFG